jgi:hypothetical protein
MWRIYSIPDPHGGGSGKRHMIIVVVKRKIFKLSP